MKRLAQAWHLANTPLMCSQCYCCSIKALSVKPQETHPLKTVVSMKHMRVQTRAYSEKTLSFSQSHSQGLSLLPNSTQRQRSSQKGYFLGPMLWLSLCCNLQKWHMGASLCSGCSPCYSVLVGDPEETPGNWPLLIQFFTFGH